MITRPTVRIRAAIFIEIEVEPAPPVRPIPRDLLRLIVGGSRQIASPRPRLELVRKVA